MFLIVVYLLTALSFSLITKELLYALAVTAKNKEKRPKMLAPLTVVSSALFVDSLYFLIANFHRYIMGDYDKYLLFLQEDHLFAIKVLLAISGLLMLSSIKKKKKDD